MILDTIAAATRQRVDRDKCRIPLHEMRALAEGMAKRALVFEQALTNRPALICEVKKASPSKGVIAEQFPYVEIAKEYELGGGSCISVLTEPQWFLGSDEIFREIRAEISLPMLRKDFTVDDYQIYQSKVMGADCVLLICALLDTETIRRSLALCDHLGLSALVEVHDEEELSSALSAGARIVGVNNRNLKDFSVDLGNAANLRRSMPEGVLFVAESGIATPQDGISLVEQGADALLIGEALMRSPDKAGFIAAIRGQFHDKD